MKRSLVPFLAAGVLLLAVPAVHAQTTAAGVLAGVEVKNDVSVKFTVGGVVQTTPVTDDVTFRVDRKVVISATETGSTVTSVVPGALNQAVAFEVTNGSNDFTDVLLAATDASTGTVYKGGDGSQTETSTKQTGATFTLYVDVNANGTYEAGTDTALPTSGGSPYIDGLAPGASVKVLAVANTMPDDTVLANNDVMVVQLVATAHSAYANQRVPTPAEVTARTTALATPGTALASGSLGAILADNKASADVAGEIDNVLADPADTTEATGDAANNGSDTSYDAFKVLATTITVAKTYGVLSDPVSSGTDKPKPIPGAVVLYCITVDNQGSTNATDVTIKDNIPAGTTYVNGSIQISTLTTLDCTVDPVAAQAGAGANLTDAADADAGDYNVSNPGAVTTKVNVNAGTQTTTLFQVTID